MCCIVITRHGRKYHFASTEIELCVLDFEKNGAERLFWDKMIDNQIMHGNAMCHVKVGVPLDSLDNNNNADSVAGVADNSDNIQTKLIFNRS